MIIKKRVLQKIVSVLSSALLLINSFSPYLLIAPTFNQVKAQTETVTPTQEPTATPTEVVTSTSTVEIPPTETPTPAPTAEPTLIPTETPTPTIEIIPTLTATPLVTPEPSPEATPSATPTINSEVKTPLRKAGNFLKEIKKQSKKNYVEGEVIVKFKKNKLNVKSLLGKAQSFVFEKKFSLNKKSEFKDLNTSVFKSKKSTEETVKELKSDSSVEYAQPNYIKKILLTPNDTNFDNLWGLNNFGQEVNGTLGSNNADIDAPEAWDFENSSQLDVVVAALDSGVAYNHPDLAGNMWDGNSNCKDESGSSITGGCPNHGWDYINSDNNPLDDNSHGTHVSGTIAASVNNSKGIAGISSQNKNKIMAVKIGDFSGSINTASEIQGINFAKNNGAKIINASYGGSNFDQAEKDAIDAFPGLFIAAAGNSGTDNESSHLFPCDFDSENIICVAATDQNDSKASFSNYGATSVDVGAPGVNIYSTVADSESFSENFETVIVPSIGNKFTQTGDMTWGTKSSVDGSNKAIFGDYANWGQYQNDKDSILESQTINLNDKENSKLDFDISCDTEQDYDGVILSFFNGSVWSDIDSYSGNSEGVISLTYSLQSYVNSNFKIRYEWIADESVNNYDGCYLDNLKITSYSDGSDEQYSYMNGTSMAAPHVAGLAALIEGYNPSLTTAQVKDKILTTGDSISALSGKTFSGRRINAYQALLASAPLSSEKTITSFTIPGQTGETVIDEVNYSIGITMPFGTDVTTLIPTITISGASVSPASGDVQDFTDQVHYTVTAEDGTTQDYVVTVTVTPDPITAVFEGISNSLEDNGITNNLNTVTSDNVNNFTGLYFEKYDEDGIPLGRLTFSVGLDLIDTETQTFLQNLGDHLDQGTGRIALDVSTATAFAEKGASLEMYDVPSASESNLIVRDDSGNILDPADIVSDFLYDEGTGTVSFAAAHFTQFDIDTEPPVIADHENITVTATSESGAVVTYTAPSANDNIDPTASASCNPVSGSTFPIGINTVTCTKTDTAGNDATPTTFTVTVTVNSPPSFDAITNQTVNEDSSSQNVSITNISPGPADEAGQTVTMSAASSDPTIIPDPLVSGSGSTRTLTYIPAANKYGTATITVTANDGQTLNNTYSRTFTITVNSVNDAPVANDDTASVDEDTILTIAKSVLLANDTDVDEGNTLSITAVSNNVHGTASIDGNNIVFTPTANYSGDASFDYTISDGNLTDTATVSITIDPVPDDPIANSQSVNTDEDTAIVITLTGSDADGDNLYYSKISNPSEGTLSEITGNQVTYTPNENYSGDDSFTFKVDDNDTIPLSFTSLGLLNNTLFTKNSNFFNTIGLNSFILVSIPTDTATVSITINPVNDAPTAIEDTYSTDEDTTLTIDPFSLLDNDTDIEGNSLTAVKVTDPANGTLTLNSNGSFTYIPSADWNGNDTFTYKANDGNTNGNTATVSITVNPINDAPVCNDVDLTTDEDTQGSTEPDCTDVDGDDLTYEIVEDPSDGTASVGSLIYDPNQDFNGSDSFTYMAIDGSSVESNEASVNVIVNAVNDAPVADDDEFETGEDIPLEISPGDLLGNDTDVDEDEQLSVIGVSNPSNGTVVIDIDNDNIIFTPVANYFGPASFDYTVSDGELTDTAAVSININTVNDAPVANDNSISTNQDTPVIITLSGSDVDEDTLTYAIVDDPVNGALGAISGDQVTYTPNSDFSGTDSFIFNANDGIDDSNTATINITIKDTKAPAVTKLGDGSADVTLDAGDTDLIFSEVLSASSKTAVQNALTAGADKGLNYSWSEGTLTITASETTVFVNDVVVTVSDVADNTTNSLLIVDSSLTATQTTPDDGTATADSDSPEVVITDPDDEVTVTVDGETKAKIDVSSFITDGTGTIPKITINSDNANVVIPATTVTGPTGWDGVIAAPTVTTVTLPEISGETLTTSAAIEIGFTDTKLSFDDAVRILLPGQAGKRAGYSRPGTAFTEITALCAADTQAAGDALGVDGECKIDSGLDLVIWTKHFTKFAAYTQTTNSTSTTSSSSSSNSGGASNPSAPVCSDTNPGSAPVLSAIAGVNTITLNWTQATDPVSYYLVAFGTKSGNYSYGNPNIGGKGTTSYTISGISGRITYYFVVRAGNGCAPGPFSNEVAVTPGGGFVEGVPAGFAAGVLGEATKSGELKEESIGKPTPTTAVINVGLVKGIQSVAKNKFSKYIFPIVSLILLVSISFYFYKKRNS